MARLHERVMQSLTLRARLLIIVLGIMLLGITTIGFTTVTALESFLISRVDTQLESTIADATEVVLSETQVAHPVNDPRLSDLPTGSFGDFIFSNGTSVAVQFSSSFSPTHLTPPPVVRGPLGHEHVTIPIGTPVTVDSRDGISYRSYAIRAALFDGTMVLSIPLTDTEDTIHRLVVAEVLISLGVVLALGLLGAVAIGVGLSPIERMRQGARAITAGDSSARVEESGPPEVRTLGSALNTMLERLQLALVESQNSQERLRQFIADVSHELRTPLTSIKGYAELYRSGALTDPHDTGLAMDRISAESGRMAALIEDLLLLARMDQNRPLVLSPANLSEISDRAVTDAQAVEPQRTLIRRIPQDVLVLGDADRLTQVVTNLLANVRTHTPIDAVATISVQRLPRDTPLPQGASSGRGISDLFGDTDETIKLLQWNEIARLTVSDTGPGLTPEQQARVFERFYRSDESRSRSRGGAGLGLALVAAIAHAHGGTAWVNSAGPGKGTTFGIDLPLLNLDEEEFPLALDKEPTTTQSRILRSLRVSSRHSS